MRLMVWIAFYVSICGMVLSALLRHQGVRSLISEAWYVVAVRAESVAPSLSVDLFHKCVGAIYKNKRNRASAGKLMLLSIASAVVFTITIDRTQNFTYPEMLAITLMLSLVFLIFEYLQLKLLLALTNNVKTAPPLLRRLLILYLSILLADSLIFYAGVQSDYFDRWLTITLFPLLAPIIFPAMIVNKTVNIALPYLYLLPFSITYLGGILIFLLAQVLLHSKRVLSATSIAIERLSAAAYTTIFNWSMALFALSTGIMQAYGF